MNSELLTPEGGAFLCDLPPEFHIVIVYEDGEAGRRAKRLSDKLQVEVGGACDVSTDLWSFDVLSILDIADAATDVACNADLLIISASGKRQLPAHVEKWLMLWAWLIDDANPAMVALFGETHGHCSYHIRLFLSMLARERGIEYFPHTNFEPRADFVSSK